MNDPVFSPGKHYRDLHFGMSRAEAEIYVGQPTTVSKMIDEQAIFPEDEAAVKDVIAYDYEKYRPHHEKEVSLTFLKDRLVEIHLNDSVEPLMLLDLNLFDKKNRKAISQCLFDAERTPYGTRENGFFPKLGVIVPWPGFWKRYKSGYVSLVDPAFILARLDFYGYELIDAPQP